MEVEDWLGNVWVGRDTFGCGGLEFRKEVWIRNIDGRVIIL